MLDVLFVLFQFPTGQLLFTNCYSVEAKLYYQHSRLIQLFHTKRALCMQHV